MSMFLPIKASGDNVCNKIDETSQKFFKMFDDIHSHVNKTKTPRINNSSERHLLYCFQAMPPHGEYGFQAHIGYGKPTKGTYSLCLFCYNAGISYHFCFDHYFVQYLYIFWVIRELFL